MIGESFHCDLPLESAVHPSNLSKGLCSGATLGGLARGPCSRNTRRAHAPEAIPGATPGVCFKRILQGMFRGLLRHL